MSWQLQEARDKLAQMVEEARRSGPQVIKVGSEEAAVLLSMDDYRRLSPRQETLAEFLMKSPLHDSGIEITRERHFGRDLDL